MPAMKNATKKKVRAMTYLAHQNYRRGDLGSGFGCFARIRRAPSSSNSVRFVFFSCSASASIAFRSSGSKRSEMALRPPLI